MGLYFPPRASPLISLFKALASPNVYSSATTKFSLSHADISVLLSICGRKGYLHLGTSIHGSLIKSSLLSDLENQLNVHNDELLIWNSLISMYCKCGDLRAAAKMFDEMSKKDTVSWNSMITGFMRNGKFETGFKYFKSMYELGVCRLDQATLTTMLSVCDNPELKYLSEIVHALAFVNGYEGEITVGNALITSYFKCGRFGPGRQVFDEMLGRNVISWTAVISGLAQNQFYEESLRVFVTMRHGLVLPNSLTYLSSLLASSGLQVLRAGQQIHALVCKLGEQSDLCLESALMDMYSKCGSLNDALEIFESSEMIDEVSMTIILCGFAQNGFEEEASQTFVRMIKTGIRIDANMVSAILGVFGVDTSLAFGMQIHCLIIKNSFGSNPFVSNGLINMYSKCGDLHGSLKVFKQMIQRNSVSWNSVIAAFARHGNGFEALQMYEDMKLDGVVPTDVTFLSLLHACSHVGLVDEGLAFLESMSRVHGISPRMEHYASAVDMLGRAGLVKEAKKFIHGLPVKPDILVWQALLGACGIHGEPEIGEYAADQLFKVQPDSAAVYILMANIYSSRERWKERAKEIRRMRENRAAKETAISWIEIDRKVHSFAVRDMTHPQGDLIYGVLHELYRHTRDEGCTPEKRFVLYFSDKERSILWQ